MRSYNRSVDACVSMLCARIVSVKVIFFFYSIEYRLYCLHMRLPFETRLEDTADHKIRKESLKN